MSTTNLGLDSPAHPLWLVAANILGDSLTILDIDRFGDVYVHSLATLIFLSNRCLYFNLNYVINKTENRRIGTVANQMYSNLCYAERAPQFREEYN